MDNWTDKRADRLVGITYDGTNWVTDNRTDWLTYRRWERQKTDNVGKTENSISTCISWQTMYSIHCEVLYRDLGNYIQWKIAWRQLAWILNNNCWKLFLWSWIVMEDHCNLETNNIEYNFDMLFLCFWNWSFQKD
jgi:hypothetical protein